MITISKAVKSDSKNIIELEERVWKEKNVTSIYDIPIFIKYGYTFVAKDENKIIGVIIAIKTKEDNIFVLDWIIDKKYRRREIGKKLYKKLITSIKNSAILSLVDENNIASINAHKKLGFKIIKKLKDPYHLENNEYVYLMKMLRYH